MDKNNEILYQRSPKSQLFGATLTPIPKFSDTSYRRLTQYAYSCTYVCLLAVIHRCTIEHLRGSSSMRCIRMLPSVIGACVM